MNRIYVLRVHNPDGDDRYYGPLTYIEVSDLRQRLGGSVICLRSPPGENERRSG